MFFKVSNNEESVLSLSTYFATGVVWGYWRKGLISPWRAALDLGLSIWVTWGEWTVCPSLHHRWPPDDSFSPPGEAGEWLTDAEILTNLGTPSLLAIFRHLLCSKIFRPPWWAPTLALITLNSTPWPRLPLTSPAQPESGPQMLNPHWFLRALHPCVPAALCLILCHPLDCSPQGYRQRILEWVAISSSKGSSWPREWTCVSCIPGGFFTAEPSGKPTLHP